MKVKYLSILDEMKHIENSIKFIINSYKEFENNFMEIEDILLDEQFLGNFRSLEYEVSSLAKKINDQSKIYKQINPFINEIASMVIDNNGSPGNYTTLFSDYSDYSSDYLLNGDFDLLAIVWTTVTRYSTNNEICKIEINSACRHGCIISTVIDKKVRSQLYRSELAGISFGEAKVDCVFDSYSLGIKERLDAFKKYQIFKGENKDINYHIYHAKDDKYPNGRCEKGTLFYDQDYKMDTKELNELMNEEIYNDSYNSFKEFAIILYANKK